MQPWLGPQFGSMAQNGEFQSSGSFQKMLERNGEVPRAVDTLVHCLIQAQAAQRPEAQAVCSWDGNLTYAELDNFSSRLANHLVTQGVTPEVLVPLCFEKSKWTAVGLLAVLKSGGAFLLLDPSQPIARLESIIKQTGAIFALSSASCFDTCKALVDKTFVLDDTTFLKLGNSLAVLCSSVKPNNAAYYIFTSGSTALPKGVIIEHSQLSTTSTYVGEHLGYGSEARVFQFASYAFDACITDIFATLVYGGTVCIPSEWERNNAVVDAMRNMEVTSAKFTPSLVRNLVFENVPSLDTLILGGESAPTSLMEEWAPKLRLILVYGPTECCVICFISDASKHRPAAGELGRPVGARAWITKQDNHNQLAEIGETGELLIEGPLVGRGYLNDQAKTDRQFIQNPAWMPTINSSLSPKRSRMYRTGDLARYLDDGRVCYAGRIDNQVKIRGQRLELEEVEQTLHACLTELGCVESKQVIVEAVMLSGLTSKQLVAFLCLSTPESLGSLEWATEDEHNPIILTSIPEQGRFLALVSKIGAMMKLLLPSYAVPLLWIPLRRIPFTVSRKADRKRLRSIVAPLSAKQLAIFTNPGASHSSTKTHVPLTENESKLQWLWAEVFGVDPSTIEPEDNFFSLGGDSVLAIKVIAAARAAGLDLSIDIIFKHPVLSEMARVIRGLIIVEEDQLVIPSFALLDRTWDIRLVRQEANKQCSIDEQCIEDIYPCSPMQEGLLALSMKDPGTYILQFVYQIPESVDVDKLKAAWETVSKSTQILRTRFFDYNSELMQVVVDESLRWCVVEGDLATFLGQDKERKLNFGEGMSRQTVLRQRDSLPHYLVWTVHHALVDGWSESDIVASVEEKYFGHSPAAPTTPKFNNFIKYLGQQDKESAEHFWRRQLAGAPAPTFPPLPEPGYIPKVQRSSRILHHLDSHAEAELEHKIPLFKRGSATPATMITAAWFLLIGMYSNSTDVVTGVTLNGRTAPLPGIDQIPGPTVTTIPFRARFTLDQKVSGFLQMIQSQYISILPHAQVGLQNIRHLSEDAVAACKFRSLLVVQSTNRPQDAKQIMIGRSYSFPVMDFAVVMECELHKGGVDFRATFDHQVLNEAQVRRMFQQMEEILHKISQSSDSTRVSELQELSREDRLQISRWNKMADAEFRPNRQTTTVRDPERPSTRMERRIHALWKTLLDTDEIGVDDNFFQLGGGSVLAMRLVSMARREGLTMTVNGIFKTPTLRGLALTVYEKINTTDLAPLSLVQGLDVANLCRQTALQCRISAEEIEDIYPCTSMQLHYVTGYPEAHKDPSDPWNWQSQVVYSLPPSIDLERFKGVWNSAVRRHTTLRTRLINTTIGIFQVVLKEIEPFRWKESSHLERYLKEDTSDNMTFGDRLLRLAVVESNDSDARFFVMTIHHTIYDAFARSMLFTELETAYFQGFPGTPLPKMNQFIKYITEADKAAATDFWTSYLAGAVTKPFLSMPSGHTVLNQREKTHLMSIPELRGSEITFPTMIEVAAGLAIAQQLGCQDVILYSDRSGRNLPVEGIQDLIGPTTLFLPVRIHINKDQKVQDLLQGAQRFQSEMMPFEHLGWLELREMSHLKDVLKYSLNMNINPHRLADLGKRWDLEFRGDWAKFDDPFGINVDLFEGQIEWKVYFDERFIGEDRVGKLLEDIEGVFLRLVEAYREPDLIVGEIYGIDNKTEMKEMDRDSVSYDETSH